MLPPSCVEVSEVRVWSRYVARFGGMNESLRITAETGHRNFSRPVGMIIRTELQKNTGKAMLRVSEK